MKKMMITMAAAFLAMGAVAERHNILLLIGDDIGLDSLPFSNDDPSASFPPIPTL